MSSEWSSLTIGDLVRSGEAIVQTGPFGSQLHSYDYVANGTAVIPTEAIGRGRILDVSVPQVNADKAAELVRHRLSVGDILFARRGAQATGLSAIVDERYQGALCGTGALLLRVRSKRVDPQFLAMYLSSEEAYSWLRTHAVGAVMPNINTDIIKALPVCFPRIEEQRSLARFLGAIDERVRLLRDTNATLEAIAQALFKSWFVDFDPVHANIAAKNAPEGAAQGGASAAQGTAAGMPEAGQRREQLPPMPAAALDATTAALFPDSFEESELGLVPKGWRIGTVEDLCSQITNGGTPSRSRKHFWDDGSIPWFKTGEFCDGFLLEPSERITEAGVNGSSVKVLPKDAVLMAIYAAPTVGRLGILTESSTFNQACTGMIAKDFVGPWFLFLTLFFGRDWFNSRANGAAQQNISKAIVAGYSVVIPDERVLSSFNEVAGALFSKIRAGAEQAQTLTQLRDTLLPRLISGQLRLPEAESLLETMP